MNILSSSLLLGCCVVPNRIVMPPMVIFKVEGSDWLPDEVHLDYYRRRANAGTGLIVVEATAVHPEGRLQPSQLRAWDDSHIPGLASICTAIKSESRSATAIVQIHHAGANTVSQSIDGHHPVAPSPVMARRPRSEMPRELADAEIDDLIEHFAGAAKRVIEAGFDGVEIHGAHGYLLSQFLSPAYNRRTGRWGGPSVAEKMRFPFAVARSAREAIGPKALISYRLGVVEYIENGLPLEQGIEAAKLLESSESVDVLSISHGMGGGDWPPVPEGFEFSPLMYTGYEVHKAVKLPVIAVGGIRTAEDAERALKFGVSDLIAVGKAMLADPDWAKKALAGKDSEIIRCLACKRCGYFNATSVCAATKRRSAYLER